MRGVSTKGPLTLKATSNPKQTKFIVPPPHTADSPVSIATNRLSLYLNSSALSVKVMVSPILGLVV